MTRLIDWVRRHHASTSHVFDDLAGDADTRAVARAHGLPVAAAEGIRTFYDALAERGASGVCAGTACRFHGGPALAERLSRTGAVRPVHCFGRCYAPPASELEPSAPPIPRLSLVDPPVVLRHVMNGPAAEHHDYELPDGPTILAAVEASGLRGRGGAAYPTAAKWRVARDTVAVDRVVVANGDEGDPGAYVDRLLLEDDPHAVLAGMLACARAIGARTGIVFIREEYPRAQERVREAIAEARARGVLGAELDVRVVGGAGSYVAGEETALLAAIEGLRAEPRPKPPYPAERGLFGLPTIVQNVETLSMIPWIVRHARQSDRKALSISGAVNAPGVVEIRFGQTLREALGRGAGGAPAGRRWKMALVGGPLGCVLPERAFDTPLSYDTLAGLGHGGVVVLDDQVSARELAGHLFEFAARESCGNCTPCRVGTSQLARIGTRLGIERVLETMELGSLCAFGQGVARPIRDLIAAFPEEMP